MKNLTVFLILFCMFISCKKDKQQARVDIYQLQSFTLGSNGGTTTSIAVIADAVTGSKIADNADIAWYEQATGTFKLKKSIKDLVKNLGPDKGFAVTVNGKPVYYGTFHPGYMSSIRAGIATIDPLITDMEIHMQYWAINDLLIQSLDKRNDPLIINALRMSGRLK